MHLWPKKFGQIGPLIKPEFLEFHSEVFRNVIEMKIRILVDTGTGIGMSIRFGTYSYIF